MQYDLATQSISAGTAEPAENKQTKPSKEFVKKLQAYLSKQLDSSIRAQVLEQLRARLATRILGSLVGCVGLILVAWPIGKVIYTEERDRQLLAQPDGLMFLLPGFVLLGIAVSMFISKRSWLLPMLAAIAVTALDVYYYNVGPEWLTPYLIPVMASCALIALAIAVGSALGTRKKTETVESVEQEIDAETDKQFRLLVEAAPALLPLPQGRMTLQRVDYLKTFPKRNRLHRPDIFARIGKDGIPRMSPIGVTAFDFGEKDVLVLEAAIDLKTGDYVYMTAHQFAYHDISAVIWSSDVWPKPGTFVSNYQVGEPKPEEPKGNEGKGSDKPVLRLEELDILLKSNHSLKILFHDGALADRLQNEKFNRIEDNKKIRLVWEKLAKARADAVS